MPIPSKAYAPFNAELLESVNRGWDTNRSRDADDGHDRTTPEEKLRTAIIAFACQDSTSFGEAMAMLVEIEQQLRTNTTRSVPVIKEMTLELLAVERKFKADSSHRGLLAMGMIAGLGWVLGIIDTAKLHQTLEHRAD